MGYMTDGLTFNALRRANMQRAKEGYSCEDWTLSDWVTALTGEVGEAANIVKKIRRGDFTLEEVRKKLADEMADIQAYLDLTAAKAGIDLGEATREKWNEVAVRIGVNMRLDHDDWHRTPAATK